MSESEQFERGTLPPADEPMSKADADYWDSALDAKAKALACLCTLTASGKGDETTKKALHALCAQIVRL